MAIHITEAAAQEARKLRETEHPNNPGVFLRLRVLGGGCSGYTYELTWETEPEPADRRFEEHGIGIVVDSGSYLYVIGSTIDYVTEGFASGYAIRNPNATEGCGCGKSHKLEPQKDDTQ